MATSERLSGTVTFLFTDIEGSTSLLKQLGRGRYGELLARHQVLLREAFAAHRGEEIDTQGDAFFVAFRSASDAVAAAIAVQRVLADHEWPEGVKLRVRVGIHSGEASAAGERYVGFSVHRAARIGGVAHGGQILLSDATRVLVEDDLPTGVYLRDLGLFRLKDVDRPERISQVVAEGMQVELPPLRGAEPVKPPPVLRRRSVLTAALVGVVAAAVAIPVFALGGGSGGSLRAEIRAPVAGNSVGIFDARNGRRTGQVTVRKRPSAVAAGLGSVWVTDVDDDSVSQINPTANSDVQTIPVGSGPSGVTVGGGFVWVSNSLSGTVSQIDPRAATVVHSVSLGGQPSGVAFGEGGVWVSDGGNRTVRRIDPVTDKLGKPIPVGAGADGVAVGVGSVWVTSQSGGVVTRIDPASGNSQLIHVGNGPSAIAVGGGSVWVTNSVDGTVSQIDPATNRVKQSISVGSSPRGVAVSPDGTVWVSNEGGSLSRIDAARGVVQTIATGNRPEGLGFYNSRLYVAVRAAGTEHRGGTLTTADLGPGTGSIDQLDPISAGTPGQWQLLLNTNDGLLAYKKVGGVEGTTLVPDLATSVPVPSDHGLTYTFQLRSGIRYSNGRPVRPADFRRAIERILATDSVDAGYYTDIVGARACEKAGRRCDLSKAIVTGSNTVSFHLTKPDPDFLYKLALPNADAVPDNTALKPHFPLPATGPYQVIQYRSSADRSVIRLKRNPYFREWSHDAQPAGYPDEIVLKAGYYADAAGDARAVERGAIDLAPINTAPAAVRSELRTRYSLQLHQDPSLNTKALWLNTRVPPFNSVNVRRAIAYAIDRNHLARLSGSDLYPPTCQFIPPGMTGYVRYCLNSHPDPARGRRLVAESGTKGETITFHVFDLSPNPVLAYLRSVLRQLGYRTRLEVVSGDTFGKEWTNSHYRWQIIFFLNWSSDFATPSGLFLPTLTCKSFQPHNSNNVNFSEFCDPRIDAEIARARTLGSTDPVAAATVWAKVDRDLVNQAPWVPYVNRRNLELVSSRIGNYVYSYWLGDVLLDQLWVR